MIDENKRLEERKQILKKTLAKAEKYNFLALEHATGVGKSFQALTLSKKYNDKPWLIVYYEGSHLNNWKEEIAKHGFDESDYTFVTYASFAKMEGEYNIIFDECHHITPRIVTALKSNIKIDLNSRILFLSATIDKNKRKLLTDNLEKYLYGKTVQRIHYYKISLIEAINLGILPKPVINVLYNTVDDTNKTSCKFVINKGPKNKRVVLSCMYSQMKTILKNNSSIELHVTSSWKEYIDYLTENHEYYWNKYLFSKEQFVLNRSLQFASQRKRVTAESKTSALKELVNYFKDKRLLCFTGSIKQCNAVGSDKVIHSKLTKKQCHEIVEDFNSKKISSIYAVNKLREGMNLVDIEKSIVVQLDDKIGTFIQMMGRSLRHDFPEIFIIIAKNTVDETKYLKKCLEGVDPNWVNYYVFEQWKKDFMRKTV